MTTSMSFVRERSSTLFPFSTLNWCYLSLWLENKFPFFTLFFCVLSMNKLPLWPQYWHAWMTHLTRGLCDDFCWVGSAKLTFLNLLLVKIIFPHNFILGEWPTKSFSPVLRVQDNYTCELWPSKQTCTCLLSCSGI